MDSYLIATRTSKLLSAGRLGGFLSPVMAFGAGNPSAPGTDWVAFLGPFHVVALHYPIGFLTLVCLLELWSVVRPVPGHVRVVGFALVLSSLAAWAAAGLGFLRAARGEFDPALVAWHQYFGIAVAAFSTLALGCLWMFARSQVSVWQSVYRGLLVLAFISLVFAGHQGGSLTHGTTFLTQNAPKFLGVVGHSGTENAGEKTDPARDVYRSSIQPILKQKCFACHGPEKQKGKLRLDSTEALLRGGKSGEPCVVPNDPTKGSLGRVLLLPRTDDSAMPPEGKEPLTDGETVLVLRWIQAGAPFGTDAAK